MTQRLKAVHRSDCNFGWELLEIEKELIKLEDVLAEMADNFMANQLRIHNTPKECKTDMILNKHNTKNNPYGFKFLSESV